MIKTNPTYIDADRLTFKEYFKRVVQNNRLLYSSVWKWWKQTTLYCFVPLTIGSLLLFALILYQELPLREEPNWGLIIALTLQPFIFMLPLIWVGSYYYSFPAARKITRKLQQFISRYIPDASHITPRSLTNYTLYRAGIEFDMGYTVIPETNSKGKVLRNHEGFFIVVYYVPQPGTELRWLDENGCMREELVDEWNAYCEGKESCKPLKLQDCAMLALFKKKELNAPHQVTDAMNQLQYLLKRFGFYALFVNMPLEERISDWLQRIDRPTPADITAINIGIFQTVTGHALYLIGARRCDETDDGWACTEDFIPAQKYLDLSFDGKDDRDWRQVQKEISSIFFRYIPKRVHDSSSLFYHKIVTVRFDDGTLTRIL